MNGRLDDSRRQIVGRIDQTDVRESLRKIAELAAPDGVVFFGEQADVVSETE
jgi:hypothetical protein